MVSSASTEHTQSSSFTATNYSTPHRTAFFNATQPTGGTASSSAFGNNESLGSGSLMDEHGMDVDGSRNDAIAMDEQQGSSVFLKPNQPSAFGSSPNGPSIFASLASQKGSPMNTPTPRTAATSFQQSPSALGVQQQTNPTFSSTPPPSTSGGEQTKQSRADRFGSNPSNNRYMELKAKRPGLMAKYIAEGKMDDPNKKYRLEDARDFVGECMDMCPEFERHEREYQKGLMEFEKIEGTDRVDHARAVKRYRRSAADDERPMPCDVRPPPVLMHTLDYLVHELLPQYDLHRTYGFIRDRTRAIRKDLTLQNVRGPEAIAIYERIARYHLLCSHRLCEVIDTQQEYEQLEKTLQSLMEFYDDSRHLHPNQPASPHEAEFRAYYLLHHIYNADIQAKFLRRFSSDPMLESPYLKLFFRLKALLPRLDLLDNANNDDDEYEGDDDLVGEGGIEGYSLFFKILEEQSTPYLMGCAAHFHFTNIRRRAYKAMFNALYVFPNARDTFTPIRKLVDLLGYDNDSDCLVDLEYFDIQTKEAEGVMYAEIGKVKREEEGNPKGAMVMGRFLEERRERLKMRTSWRILEGKVTDVEVGDIVDGSQYTTQDVDRVQPLTPGGKTSGVTLSVKTTGFPFGVGQGTKVQTPGGTLRSPHPGALLHAAASKPSTPTTLHGPSGFGFGQATKGGWSAPSAASTHLNSAPSAAMSAQTGLSFGMSAPSNGSAPPIFGQQSSGTTASAPNGTFTFGNFRAPTTTSATATTPSFGNGSLQPTGSSPFSFGMRSTTSPGDSITPLPFGSSATSSASTEQQSAQPSVPATTTHMGLPAIPAVNGAGANFHVGANISAPGFQIPSSKATGSLFAAPGSQAKPGAQANEISIPSQTGTSTAGIPSTVPRNQPDVSDGDTSQFSSSLLSSTVQSLLREISIEAIAAERRRHIWRQFVWRTVRKRRLDAMSQEAGRAVKGFKKLSRHGASAVKNGIIARALKTLTSQPILNVQELCITELERRGDEIREMEQRAFRKSDLEHIISDTLRRRMDRGHIKDWYWKCVVALPEAQDSSDDRVKMSLKWIRSKFGLQDGELVKTSHSNLTYLQAGEEPVNLHTTIRALPLGYSQPLADAPDVLSGSDAAIFLMDVYTEGTDKAYYFSMQRERFVQFVNALSRRTSAALKPEHKIPMAVLYWEASSLSSAEVEKAAHEVLELQMVTEYGPVNHVEIIHVPDGSVRQLVAASRRFEDVLTQHLAKCVKPKPEFDFFGSGEDLIGGELGLFASTWLNMARDVEKGFPHLKAAVTDLNVFTADVLVASFNDAVDVFADVVSGRGTEIDWPAAEFNDSSNGEPHIQPGWNSVERCKEIGMYLRKLKLPRLSERPTIPFGGDVYCHPQTHRLPATLQETYYSYAVWLHFLSLRLPELAPSMPTVHTKLFTFFLRYSEVPRMAAKFPFVDIVEMVVQCVLAELGRALMESFGMLPYLRPVAVKLLAEYEEKCVETKKAWEDGLLSWDTFDDDIVEYDSSSELELTGKERDGPSDWDIASDADASSPLPTIQRSDRFAVGPVEVFDDAASVHSVESDDSSSGKRKRRSQVGNTRGGFKKARQVVIEPVFKTPQRPPASIGLTRDERSPLTRQSPPVQSTPEPGTRARLQLQVALQRSQSTIQKLKELARLAESELECHHSATHPETDSELRLDDLGDIQALSVDADQDVEELTEEEAREMEEIANKIEQQRYMETPRFNETGVATSVPRPKPDFDALWKRHAFGKRMLEREKDEMALDKSFRRTWRSSTLSPSPFASRSRSRSLTPTTMQSVNLRNPDLFGANWGKLDQE
ncbi:hypothetical protein HDU85_000205 [Gaertneriomyces sp. JEL0708]|nr:hypothetical protein HDU85_000205 [Gaertneriomyces sp. JEL0708]